MASNPPAASVATLFGLIFLYSVAPDLGENGVFPAPKTLLGFI
jgi:hypothetical protein